MKKPTALELSLAITIDVPEAAEFGPDPDVTIVEPSPPCGSTKRGARAGTDKLRNRSRTPLGNKDHTNG